MDLTFKGDQESLRQVFTNLIENALKYTPQDGRVSLEVCRNWDQIEVAIANSGEPIPPEHLPHIFERFYRIESSQSRDAGGAGLGLVIAREIVRRHGSEIQVQSQPEIGTIFTVRLHAGES